MTIAKKGHEWEKPKMKTLFLGHFAAAVAPRILSKVETPVETQILKNEGDLHPACPQAARQEVGQ